MYGALLRNDRGGLLISPDAPVYMRVEPTNLIGNTLPGIDGRNFIGRGRGISGKSFPSPLGFYTNLTEYTVLLPSNKPPKIAVKTDALPHGFDYGLYQKYYDHVPTFKQQPYVYGTFRKAMWGYIQTIPSSFAIIRVSREPSLDANGLYGWKFVTACNLCTLSGAKPFRFYCEYNDAFRDKSAEYGMTVYGPNGVPTFSASMLPPYTGDVMKVKHYTSLDFGAPLTSTSFTSPSVNHYRNYGKGCGGDNSYRLLSSGGYGVAATDLFALWGDAEMGFNGWSEVSYNGIAIPYITGFTSCGGVVMLPVGLSTTYDRSRSDSSFNVGSLVAIGAAAFTGGASLAALATTVAVAGGAIVNISNSTAVTSANTTYDGHLNTIITVE